MLSFANAPGNYYNRIGKLGALIKNLYSYQQTQLPYLLNQTTGVPVQFATEPDIQATLGALYPTALNNADSFSSTCQNVAGTIVNRMVFRDNPQIAQNLQALNVLTSLYQIILQMRQQGASILAMTITATPGLFPSIVSNHGNGVLVASTKRPIDGLVLENTFAENVLFVCSQDSYTGSATPFNEPFNVTGTSTKSQGYFNFNWPVGSGCQITINAVDGDTSNGSGNLLNDSNFSSWANTANVPDQWVLASGTAGTNTFQNTSFTYGQSTSSLQLTGAGGTPISLTQQFNSLGGTSTNLSPLTQYSHNIFLRRDGTVAGAGVLTIDLIDQNGNTVADQNGVLNTYNIDLTGLTTNFVASNGVFRTPAIMPSSIYLRMRTSTPLTNGRSVYLAKSSLGLMSQLYTSGPFVSLHSGSTPFLQGDYQTIAFTNSRGAGGTLSTFQTLLGQLYPSFVYPNELLFPSSSSPTISDSLIG